MEKRLSHLRKELNITQEHMGNRLGITRAAISRLESGHRNLTESMIKLICSELNVNEDWLRTGEGEMFNEIPTDELDKLAEKYKLNPLAKKIVESFVTLEEHEMDAVLKLVANIASANDEIAVARESIEENYIESELENYRRELEAEKKGTISSVSEDIEGSKAK